MGCGLYTTKAKACADYYQEISVRAAGLGKATNPADTPFDSDYAERLCDDDGCIGGQKNLLAARDAEHLHVARGAYRLV